jgi:hypothetical protein
MDAELTDDGTDTGASGDDQRAEPADADGGTVSVTVDGQTATFELPADADSDEAAAIATAVGAHLTDRARAAAAAAASESKASTDRADQWTLATRMKAVGKRRWPDDVERGEEWKAAARSFY